jgi:hypothetical protein
MDKVRTYTDGELQRLIPQLTLDDLAMTFDIQYTKDHPDEFKILATKIKGEVVRLTRDQKYEIIYKLVAPSNSGMADFYIDVWVPQDV